MRVKSLFAASVSESNLFHRMEIAALMKRYALLCTRYRWKNLKEQMGKKKENYRNGSSFFNIILMILPKCVRISFLLLLIIKFNKSIAKLR